MCVCVLPGTRQSGRRMPTRRPLFPGSSCCSNFIDSETTHNNNKAETSTLPIPMGGDALCRFGFVPFPRSIPRTDTGHAARGLSALATELRGRKAVAAGQSVVSLPQPPRSFGGLFGGKRPGRCGDGLVGTALVRGKHRSGAHGANLHHANDDDHHHEQQQHG